MESDLPYETIYNEIISPLQRSLLIGSVDKIQKILREKYGSNLSSQTDKIHKCKEIVKVCLDLKLNLNLKKSKYSTLLHFAARKLDDLDVEIFKSVLSRKSQEFNINASLHLIGHLPKTLLHIVIKEGKENLVKALLDFGADVNVKDHHKETPLFYATLKENATLVRLLLNYGAEMQYENFKLGSSHSLAIWDTSKEVLEILLEAGYDVTVKNNGMLPIDFIFDKDFPTWNYYWKNVKLLCAYGSDMNLNNETGTELLHSFCKNGLLDDVLFAVKYGADLFGKENGNTALHKSVFGNNFDLVDFLLRHGLDINAKDSYNDKTPLHGLSEFSNSYEYDEKIVPEFREERTKQFVAMIEFIVDNGADVNARDFVFLTPAETSIKYNILDISECFFALSAVVDFEWLIRCFANTTGSFHNDRTRNIPERKYMFMLLIGVLATKEDDIPRYLLEVPNFIMSRGIKDFFEECKSQVNQMKASKICRDSNISFFDFMSKDLMDVTNFSSIEEIMLILESGEYKKKFPAYKYLLEKRVERVKLLRNYLNVFTLFLNKFFKGQLPFVVLHIIFSFLRVGDVRNFGRALRISNDFPNGKYCIE